MAFSLYTAFLLVHCVSAATFLQRPSTQRLNVKKRISNKAGGANILYGLESCNKSAYNSMVETQLTTWGSSLPRENFVIVNGARDDYNDKVVDEESPCTDEPSELACKEAVMMYRAASRVRSIGADWLAVGQDDKYIWPQEFENALSKHDPRKPAVLAVVGCGKGWQHHEESKNGTEPRPKGWVEPEFSCKAVYEQGSICGGATYIVSRGALELLTKGSTSQSFVADFLSHSVKGTNSDLAASCFFYSRGISISTDLDIINRFVELSPSEADSSEDASFVNLLSKDTPPLTAHLHFNKENIPSVMKNIYSTFSSNSHRGPPQLELIGYKVTVAKSRLRNGAVDLH